MSILNAPAFASYAASNDVDMSNNFAQDALAVAVGSVVDFGVSLHNSFNWAWGGEDASTYDVLNSMGMDTMASGYLEHKGLINTLSFVGGMFIPGMAGIKLSRIARAGIKGTTLLSPTHSATSFAKLAKLTTEAKKGTKAFRSLQSETMYTAIGQGLVDNAAAELAIVASMNAHPFMEDYMDDFGTNFASSLLIGSSLGAAVDAASTWYGIKRAVGGAESVAQQAVINQIPTRSLATDGIVNFQETQTLIRNMDNLIQNPEVSELSRQIAIKTRTTAVEMADTQLQSGLTGQLAKDMTSSDEMASHLRNVFGDEALLGVGKADYYKVKSLAPSPKGGIRKWAGTLLRKNVDPTTGDESFSVKAVFSPREGYVVNADDANALAGAADIVTDKDVATMAKSISPYKLDDVALDMQVENQAFIESKYLAAIKAYDSMNIPRTGAVIHESDLPSVHGLMFRADKSKARLATIEGDIEHYTELLKTADPSEAAKINKTLKSLQKETEELNSLLDTPVKLISDANSLFGTKVLTKAVQKSTGIKPTHLQDLDNITRNAPVVFAWEGLSTNAQRQLRSWQDGNLRELRKAVADYRRGGGDEWIKEIMEHPERKRQHAELRKHADSDGYIYLRRGQHTKPNGHFEVESYTTSPQISRKFAGSGGHDYAYRVHVDDVIGNVGYTRGFNEAEWLVMAPTREYGVDTSKFNKVMTNEADNTLATSIPSVSLRDIKSHADEATVDLVKQLALREQAPEEIARRTNLDTESVLSILGSHGSAKELKYFYSDAAKMSEYLSPKNKLISLSDNGNLTTYAKYVQLMQNQADQAILDKWNTEATISLMQTSGSATVKDFMDSIGLAPYNKRGRNEFFNMHDTLKSTLGNIADGLAGNRFLQSADMYSRQMDDAGFIINRMGEQHARIANKAIDQLIGPANEYLSAIARSEPELVAHNVIVQAVRSSGKKLRLTDDFELMEVHGLIKNEVGEMVEDLRPLVYMGKEIAIPDSMPNVQQLFSQYDKIGKELQQMRITQSKVLGAALPSDKGLWLPSFNPRTKYVGFVRTTKLDELGNAIVDNKIVTGNTLEELNEKRGILQQRANTSGDQLDFIWPKERTAKQSVEYDKLKQQALRGKLQLADTADLKMGYAAEEIPNATLEEARNLLHGYSASIYAHTQDIQGLLMSDIVDKLDRLSEFSTRALDNQAMSKLTKFFKQETPAASIMKSTLLGSKDLMDNYVPAKVLNDGFSSAVDTAITKVNKIADTLSTNFANKNAKVIEKWEEVDKELAAAGIPNPFAGLDALYVERTFATEVSSGDARRLVSVGNAFASTMALRFMEIAHPLVNMLSMPILAQSALGGSAASLMGRHADDAKGLGMFAIARHMGNGVRYMNNPPPAAINLYRKAEANGIFKAIVSEATDVVKLTRLREKGGIAVAERLVDKIDNTLGGKLVAASDWSETLSRKTAFGTGVSIAMERYGLKLGLDDDKIFLFARDFVDRSIGNYAAHQRPVMFHGTLGAAAGLFQTYMVTFAQNIYRNLEARDFATLAKTMAWQGSIFGLNSLPGYDLMSRYIGEHYTNDHTDLISGAYKHLDDGLANTLVYGLPSNIGALWGDSGVGPNLSTRGAVDPRIGVPAAQMLWDSATAISNVGSRLGLAGDTNAARGMLEALSVQSISRPIARISELFLDYSITSQGRTVSTPEEVWTPIGVGARLIGTRTTEEWRTRTALHLNTYYGSKDRDNRKSAMEDVRTMIRAGEFNDATLTKAFDRYLENGGTAQGFRAALNNAVEFEAQSMDYRLFEDIKPDSPILHMIDTM